MIAVKHIMKYGLIGLASIICLLQACSDKKVYRSSLKREKPQIIILSRVKKDEVIAGYRHLMGKAVMLPKWVYGFWQSRERYKSSDEIVNTFKEYRDRKIPIDNIVLDWSYWPVDAWGSHDFYSKFFPDAKALTDKIHAMNGNIMISVWPKFYPITENYKELNAKFYMFNKNLDEKNLDWIWPSYANAFYDPFQKNRKLFSGNKLAAKLTQKVLMLIGQMPLSPIFIQT